jgi:hypothetical protein
MPVYQQLRGAEDIDSLSAAVILTSKLYHALPKSTFRGRPLPAGLSPEAALSAEAAIARWEESDRLPIELVLELFAALRGR